jgi:hypothetical protein
MNIALDPRHHVGTVKTPMNHADESVSSSQWQIGMVWMMLTKRRGAWHLASLGTLPFIGRLVSLPEHISLRRRRRRSCTTVPIFADNNNNNKQQQPRRQQRHPTARKNGSFATARHTDLLVTLLKVHQEENSMKERTEKMSQYLTD